MAKQKNQYYIGRQGNLIYYQWRDVYCIRTKGSLDRKRFYQDKAFEGSRKRAEEFGVASKLASEVYQQLPQELKRRGFIGTLTGWAHKKLMNGRSREEVINEMLVELGVIKPVKIKSPGTAPIYKNIDAGNNWQLSGKRQAESLYHNAKKTIVPPG